MKGQKNKKKYGAVQTPEPLNSQLINELKLLNETYQKHFISLINIKRDATNTKDAIAKKTVVAEANKLQNEILNILKSSTEIVKNHPINEALLLNMRIRMIYGLVACFTQKYELAMVAFHNIFQSLIAHDKILKYEDDLCFQHQIENFISECNFIHHGGLCRGSTKQIIKDGQVAYSLFVKRSMNTIVGLQMKFFRYTQLYSIGYRSSMDDQLILWKLNAQYKEYNREFFLSARTIKRSLDSKNERNELTIEEQLHYLMVHFFMLNIDEMTHPHTVWKIVPRYNQEAFMVADNLTNIRLERYFNVWQTFKETYIKPSIELIKKIDFDALHPHIELHDKYENIINKWRAYFHMSISLCVESTKALLHYIDSQESPTDPSYDEDKSNVCASIDDIRKEQEFLSSSVHIIEAFAEQCQHKFAKSLVAEVENFSKSEGRIEALKDEVEQTKETKIKIANVNAKELICEEEAKATARQEKLQQQLLKKQTFFHDAQHKPQTPVIEDETILDTLMIIDPERQKLESIDEQAAYLARTLKSKTDNLIDFIQKRVNFKVPLPSHCHADIYSQINFMLVEYHQLVALFDEHRFLSQQKEYPKETLEGIATGQNDLQVYCKEIFSNIKHILEMIDTIMELQKQSRNEYIMKIGYAKFVSIGRQKEANNQKYSEHAQQRELLELLQLTFSALNYLQNKIQTHIFDGHNEELKNFGFFSRVETHGKHAELSKGRYEGLLGLILKQHFSETGDIKYLLESKTHFLNAYNAFEADKNVKAAQHVNKCLKEIEESLVTMNNNEVVSMQMK